MHSEVIYVNALFPTNPINALEASYAEIFKGEERILCFQLIQLTHWKRATDGGTKVDKLMLVSN